MDKIFSEIKKAIEEEMRNAESGPPPGGGRAGGGGRRAQEYAEWLKEEQSRLRGDQPQPQPQPLERQTISTEDGWDQQAREREEAALQRRQDRRDRLSSQRSQSSQSRPQQVQTRQQPRRQAEQQPRAERRPVPQTRNAYDQRSTGAATRRRVQRMLSTNQGLRQAFLIREIVSKPVSLRDKDDHLIS